MADNDGSNLITVQDCRESSDFDIDNRIVDQWIPIIGLQGLALYSLYVRMGNKKDAVAFPGYTLIQRHLGIGRSTISRYNHLLQCCGLLRIKSGTRTTPNYYYILDVPDVTLEYLEIIKGKAAQLGDAKFVRSILTRIDSWQPIEAHYAHQPRDEVVVILTSHENREGSPVAEHPTIEGSPVAEHLTIEGSPVAGKGVPLQDCIMHACIQDNNNDNAPTRRSRALTVKALTAQYPVQPDDLSPDQAFNLALDKALALLPAKLRKRADAPLYALAGELHPTAREHPSRAWPDASGAGWILDAVLDAVAKGPVGSVNLIRTITERWLTEGNPYAVKPPPVDDPLAVFVQLADDYTPSDRDRCHLSDLRAEGYSDDEIVAGIQRAVAGARQRGVIPRSFGYCVPAVREIPPSQPSRAAMHDRGAVPGAIARTGEKATAVPTNPVLVEVVGMYESEIGSVTERTVQRLMALTEEHRDIGKWREAFDAVVQSNVRRLDYLVKCLENAGKPKPRSKPVQRGRGYKQRPQRAIREKPPAEDVDAETRARQRAALAELKERQLSQPSRR